MTPKHTADPAPAAANASAGWATGYERDILPGLVAARRRARGKFILLLGVVALTHRHEMNDLLRLQLGTLPVALCSAQIFRRQCVEPGKVTDVRVFAGTVFEVGCRLPLDEPVVVASASVDEPPVPPGAKIGAVDLGGVAAGLPLRVWAPSEAAARAMLPRDVLSRLAAFTPARASKWQLVFDRDGVVGAIDAPPESFTLYLNRRLPTAEEALGEITRVQTALELIDSVTAGRTPTPRALVEFEGSYDVLPVGAQASALGSPAAAREAAFAAARGAGLAIDDWGGRLAIRYRWPRMTSFNAAAVVVWPWVAAEIAGLATGAPGQGQGLQALADWAAQLVPEAAALPAWLTGWHPWSTLVVASTCLPPWWTLLAGEVRQAEVGRGEAHVVCGLLGRRQHRVLADGDDVRVERGIVRAGSGLLAVSPRLDAGAAAALARLLALHGNWQVTLPPTRR